MLQQTQVDRVIPYYERFLQTFPTVEALAAASLDEVLRLWEGLGYYSRARNLHRAAQILTLEHHSLFPQDLPGILKLPGIGRYTAGAILSIAFDVRLAALDGNALRVFSRVFWLTNGGRSGEEKRLAERLGQQAVPATRPGDYTQALMELGATVCTPRSPQCPMCPLQDLCIAFGKGAPEAVPSIQRKQSQAATVVGALVWRRGRLLVARRPEQGVWAGLWELPNIEIGAEQAPSDMLSSLLSYAFGLTVRVENLCHTITHGLMNRRLTLHVYNCTCMQGHLHCREHQEGRWMRPDELVALALPAPHRRVVQSLFETTVKNRTDWPTEAST